MHSSQFGITFTDSRGPVNSDGPIHCIRSLNRMVRYSVMPVCDTLAWVSHGVDLSHPIITVTSFVSQGSSNRMVRTIVRSHPRRKKNCRRCRRRYLQEISHIWQSIGPIP